MSEDVRRAGPLVRRSNLLVASPSEALEVLGSPAVPDALSLDPGPLSPGALRKEELRQLLQSVEPRGVELFIHIPTASPTAERSMDAELEELLLPGIDGVLLGPAESALAVGEADRSLWRWERRHQVETGSVEILLAIGSPAGVWNVRELLGATARLREVWFDEGAFRSSLGVAPQMDVDPFLYARGRVISEVTAAGMRPIGSIWSQPCNVAGDVAGSLVDHAVRIRNLGFRGLVCHDSEAVPSADAAFTPSGSQIDYAKQVEKAFAEGVASGTAAVALDGRLIDVPVVRSGQALLELSDACAVRDRMKSRRSVDGAVGRTIPIEGTRPMHSG